MTESSLNYDPSILGQAERLIESCAKLKQMAESLLSDLRQPENNEKKN